MIDPAYVIRALLWLAGIPLGLGIRFTIWGKKQPRETTVSEWWHARKAANVQSLLLGLVFTFLWAEGSLYRIAHLEKLGVELTYGLTLPFSAGVTAFAHYLLAAGKRRAEAAAGGSITEED